MSAKVLKEDMDRVDETIRQMLNMYSVDAENTDFLKVLRDKLQI